MHILEDALEDALQAVKIRNDDVTARTGRRPLAHTRTFGCQQNEADTERLRGQLSVMGFEMTDVLEDADLMLLNTCAVREHAEFRVFGHLGSLKHWKTAKAGRVLALCGCMAQQEHVAQKVRNSFSNVDVLFGTHALPRFPALLAQHYRENSRVYDTCEGGPLETTVAPLRAAPPVARVPIMQGCNNFCSYCIVPYVRGREHSRSAAEISAEVSALLAGGYKDITLLGQNVNSYHDGDVDFKALLRKICALEGDYQVRFLTSHPKDCTPALLQVMSELPAMARQLHLPVQAGSDAVLAAMNRGYTSAHYRTLLDTARRLMPDVTLTSDIMVGFPGETEADFEETLSLVAYAGYDNLFTFLYSPRQGTPAAALPQLTHEVKQARFDRLVALQNDISHQKHKALLGTTLRVLVDGHELQGEYPLTARTGGGRLVRLTGGASLVGQFVQAEITGHTTWNLYGKVES